MAEVTHSRTSQVINKPIEEVWDFVTVPNNWVKLGMGTWKVHGLKGEDDMEPVSRTMKEGERFLEYMNYPNRFDFVGDWVVTVSEKPYKWGFRSIHWYGVAMPVDIEATYTLEKIDDNTTKWSRHRVNTPRPGKSNDVDFLSEDNDVEDDYQRNTKSFIEKGVGKQPPIHPQPPHEPGWLATLERDP
ncbi:hypothetical protein BKA56DRAFT_669850 [Ilyonectria sp. MPI-CAGE-AT-0026]|nr:hypothetical protein BKA56DRAFT_669850 [Ilyonectria sp. MPI-CAGE-AT-0026]